MTLTSSLHRPNVSQLNPDLMGLGEPIFAYPPMMFGKKDDSVSIWHHIAHSANIGSKVPSRGMNLNTILHMRNLDKLKHSKVMY